MIKAIIFDCFGVLVGRGFDRTYKMAGGDPAQDRSFIESTLGRANLGLINETEFGAVMAQQIGIGSEDWTRVIKNTERRNIDLLNYIKQLRSRYKTAILSNANNGVLDRVIGEEWLQQSFDAVVVSAEVGIVKPDQRIYQLVVDRLGVTPDKCLYIDDREKFLEPAKHMGMSVLLYENFDQIRQSIDVLLG